MGSGPVLIVAQQHTGHHLTYVRLLAQAVLDRGDRVVLAVTEAGRRSPEWTLHLSTVAPRCEVTRLTRTPPSVGSLSRLARQHRCERVLIPDGDRVAIRLGLRPRRRGRVTFVVLVLSDPQWSCDPRPSRRLRMRVKSLVLRRTGRLARTRLLYLADPSQGDAEGRSLAPDPVVFDAGDGDPAQLRRHLGLDPDRFWFLVAGAISPRKNLPLVLRALLPLAGSGAGLFVCGALDPPVREAVAPLLARAAAADLPVVRHDRTQTDHQLNRAIQAVDCVVVAYSTDAPTSMMSKSVRAGRRVIVAGSPSLRRWAGNLGIDLVGPLDRAALTGLLRRAMDSPMPAPRPDLDHTAFVRAFL